MARKRIAIIQWVVAMLGVIGWLLFGPGGISVVEIALATAWLLSTLTVMAQFGIGGPAIALVHGIYDHYWLSRILIVIGVLGCAAGIVLFPFTIHRETLMGWLFFGPYVLLWPWVFMGTVLSIGRNEQNRVRPFAVGVIGFTILAGVILALVELALQIIYPRFLPATIAHSMPQAPLRIGQIRYDTPHGAREYKGGVELSFDVAPGFGDLIGSTCLRAEDVPPIEPYHVKFTRDDHGFRNAMPWPDDIDLAVVGDSFTAAEYIIHPFWQNLTPTTLEFGVPGSGSLEQSWLLDEHILPRSPEVVVMAYFEGNDLVDTWFAWNARQSGQNLYEAAVAGERPWNYLILYNVLAHALEDSPSNSTQEAPECPLPVQDNAGNTLAFSPWEMSLLTMDPDLLRSTRYFGVTREAILDAALRVEQSGAQFVLAFLPQSAHVYWPGLDAEAALSISQLSNIQIPSDDGLTVDTGSSGPAEIARRIQQNLDNQRDMLADLAEEEGFYFLDFTPHFQQAAADGDMLYFSSDTHWNQRGHDLARSVLREFLIENDLLPADLFQG